MDCQTRLHALQVQYYANSSLKKIEQLALSLGYVLPRNSFVDGSRNDEAKPKLRLTIRASGIDHPGYVGNLPPAIPKAVTHSNPPGNIKVHPQHILFHLPPKMDLKSPSSPFAVDDAISTLETYKRDLRAAYYSAFPVSTSGFTDEQRKVIDDKKKEYRELIAEISKGKCPQAAISFFHQTAFANTGGKAFSIDADEIEGRIDVSDETIPVFEESLII